MKSPTTLLKLTMLMSLICMSLSMYSSSSVMAKSFAVFSINNSNISLKGPSQNNFKGNVSLDTEARGFVIATSDGDQNEALLRLVSEKLESDSYLIDYRLMRSCDFPLKISSDNNNLNLNFSPKSLENRNKNDNFEIVVEIFNFKTFIPDEKYRSEQGIQAYLKSQCQERKEVITNLKNKFKSAVIGYRMKYEELKEINNKLNSQKGELENLKTAITDAETQIRDINYLQNSYDMQLKSISNINSGANKLITTENVKKTELLGKQKIIDQDIKSNTDLINSQNENLIKLKEKYSKSIEKSKDVENTIINNQKDLADVENSISNLKSKKMSLEFDLKNTQAMRVSREQSTTELSSQIKNYNKENEKNMSKLKSLKTEKNKIETFISDEKEEIKYLESKINEMILKKSNKEENLKSKYDEVKVKEELITNIKIENDQYITNIKRLSDKIEKLENSDKIEIDNKIENLKYKITVYEKKLDTLETTQKSVNKNLKEINTKKEAMNKRLSEDSKEMEKVNNDILISNKKRMDFEKKKADLNVEIRDKDSKLKNLRMEGQNYYGETENVKKSLTSAGENLQTFNSILSDFSSKLKPVEKKHNLLIQNKTKNEKDIKEYKLRIKSSTGELKKNTPSAVVMIDLAEDEAFNEVGEESDKAKWRVLIEKIIS